jgi:hypothetical protein
VEQEVSLLYSEQLNSAVYHEPGTSSLHFPVLFLWDLFHITLPCIQDIGLIKAAFLLLVSPPKFILHFCSVPYIPHTPTILSYVILSSSSVSSSLSLLSSAAANVPQYKPVSELFCLALVSLSLLLSAYIHFFPAGVCLYIKWGKKLLYLLIKCCVHRVYKLQ